VTKEQIRAVLDRVLTWPPERQADAAEVLQRMEAMDDGAYRLSEEQRLEVERRRAERDPQTLTIDEFNRHVCYLGCSAGQPWPPSP
jgi:hypothetical protein